MHRPFGNVALRRHRLLLVIAALWNLAFGSLGMFMLPQHIELFYVTVTPAAELLANTWTWAAVFIIGAGYALAGIAHPRYRFFLTLGAIGKYAFFFFVLDLWISGVATPFAMVVGTGDLLWALYFTFFLYMTREHGYI